MEHLYSGFSIRIQGAGLGSAASNTRRGTSSRCRRRRRAHSPSNPANKSKQWTTSREFFIQKVISLKKLKKKLQHNFEKISI